MADDEQNQADDGDNVAIARALFSTPQELFARIADSDEQNVETTFGAMGIGNASATSTAMWLTATEAGAQDLQVVRAMNLKDAIDLTPPEY